MVGKPAVKTFGMRALNKAQGRRLVFKGTVLPTHVQQRLAAIFIFDIDITEHAVAQKSLADRQTGVANGENVTGSKTAACMFTGLKSIKGGQTRSVKA